MALHLVLLGVVIVVPLLMATNQLPAVVPTMMAFVTPAPTAPPPPPPPPPPGASAPKPAQTADAAGQFAAPVEAPAEIQPERVSQVASAGVLGGVEGGVPGGVLGGVVGGIVEGVATLPPAPPPPPPPPPARTPVRIGGQIKAPALLHRVEPVYPEIAAVARLSGIVILEALVSTDGCVESVKVLRSRHQLLDSASIEAVKQWQYSPLVLNGIATPFVLTVTFTFSVQ
jgi:protein TonB